MTYLPGSCIDCCLAVSFNDGMLRVAPFPVPKLGRGPAVGEREPDRDLERACVKSRNVASSGIGGSLKPTGTDSDVEMVEDHALTFPASSCPLVDNRLFASRETAGVPTTSSVERDSRSALPTCAELFEGESGWLMPKEDD